MTRSREEQILKAAGECFARYGYKKTTLDDIGKLVGLNKASIYHYFKNKEDIFVKAILNEFEIYLRDLQNHLKRDVGCEEQIVSYFLEKLEFWQSKGELLPLFHEMDPDELKFLMETGTELYMDIEQRERSFLAEILKNCIRDGHIRQCDVDKVSSYLFALAEGIKNSHMDFSASPGVKNNTHKEILDDVKTALLIFLDGLRINTDEEI